MKKPSLKHYFSKYSFQIILYILITLLSGVASILCTIFLADAIEYITLSDFDSSLTYFLYALGAYISRRICWFTCGVIYDHYSVRIKRNEKVME